MKRLLLLGLGAFLLVILIVLPARWIAPLLPATVHCAAWHGSVWRGQCDDLTVSTPQPQALDQLRWKLRPLSLLRLTVSADVEMAAPAGTAEGRVDLRPGGALALRAVAARGRFDQAFPGVLPRGWQGQLETRALALQLDGRVLRELGGEIFLRDLADVRGQGLGSYHLAFPASTRAPYTGALQDSGGPLEVRAQLVVQADRSWTLDGTVRPRDAAAQGFERQLEVLGPRDASGRHRLSLAGTFR
jgi:hypothetical protein